LPEVELDAEQARLAAHGVAVTGEAEEPIVRLSDADGLIALAEPQAGGLLKPVIVLRPS
jgi:hypothetical protein